MTSDKIRFAPSVSPEVRNAIEPHIVRWAFLVPAWCQEVDVHWDDGDSGGSLRMDTSYEYRRADLFVLPNFLSCEPDHRETDVVHELLHIVTAPIDRVAQDFRDVLVKDNKSLKPFADEMIRRAIESVTCDLTQLIRRTSTAWESQ